MGWPKCHPSARSTTIYDLQFMAPRFLLPLGQVARTSANYVIQKVFLAFGKHYFLQSCLNRFPTRPRLWLQKYPVSQEKHTFHTLAWGRPLHWSRKTSLDFGFFGQASGWTSGSFLAFRKIHFAVFHILVVFNNDSIPYQRKHMFSKL